MAQPVTVESNATTPVEAPHATEQRARALWQSLQGTLRRPAIGAGVAGATVLAAGAIWGVTEAALAGVAAWAVFRALKKRGTRRESTPEGSASSG